MRRFVPALLILSACASPPLPAAPTSNAPAESVWSVDLVRTLPGAQADYLRSIEANWAGARVLARERAGVLSYRALVAAPDSSRGWDVLLMTEYADSAAWAGREEAYRAIFASPEFVPLDVGRASAEMRAFEASGVPMHPVVSAP